MANQDLINYVSAQVKQGVSEDTIKKELSGIGWPEADIADAIRSVKSPAAPASTSSLAAMPAAGTVSPAMGMSAAAPKTVSPLAASMGGTSPAAPQSPVPAQTKASPFTVIDAFQPKSEPLRSVDLSKNMKKDDMEKMDSFPPASRPAKGATVSIPYVVSTVLAVALVVVGFMLYRAYANVSDLTARLAAAQIPATGGSQGNGQSAAAFQATIDGLNSQLAALKADNDDLAAQISLVFAIPASNPAATDIMLKGAIGGSEKTFFTLTTGKGIVANIKNSKDPKVIAALSGIIGSTVQISGTHLPGSKDITLTVVNGQPINNPSNAATSTTSSIPTASGGTPTTTGTSTTR